MKYIEKEDDAMAIEAGQMVTICTTSSSSQEFIEDVAKMENEPSEVISVHGGGICTILLPNKKRIRRHSQTIPRGKHRGRQHMDIPEGQLRAVEEKRKT